jgi:benzodiazapine receptor
MASSDWYVYAPIIIVVIVAVFGYIATRRAVAPDGWYSQINKAPLTPPNWVFGVVWFILYILITIAWVRANADITDVGTFDMINWMFVINLILNLAWSFFFFGDGNVVAGLIILILLIANTAYLIYLLRYSVLSMVFIGLYLLWLLFALYLNIGVLMKNRIVPAPAGIWTMFTG